MDRRSRLAVHLQVIGPYRLGHRERGTMKAGRRG